MPAVVDAVHILGKARVTAPQDGAITTRFLKTESNTFITGDVVHLDTWRADLQGKVQANQLAKWSDESHRDPIVSAERARVRTPGCTRSGEILDWTLQTSPVHAAASNTWDNSRESLLDDDVQSGVHTLAGSSSSPSYIQADLGEIRTVDMLRIGTTSSASYVYNAYVKVSNSSAGPWTQLFRLSSSKVPTAYKLQTVEFPEATVTRYARLLSP